MSIDILRITETYLCENIGDAEIEIEGYIFVRSDRKTGPYGGVGCYTRDGIGWQRGKDLEKDIKVLSIEIYVPKST